MLEIKTPIPNDPMMKITLNPINAQKLPATVTPKSRLARISRANRLKTHTSKYGMIFPNINSHALMGVTINCSMVPCSRSFTIANADKSNAWTCKMIGMSPGMM